MVTAPGQLFPPRGVSKSLALDSDFFDVCRMRVIASSAGIEEAVGISLTTALVVVAAAA